MDIAGIANSGALTTKAYVPGKSKQDVQRELGLKNIVKMASNESAIGPSPLGLQAFHEVAERLHIYPDSISRELRAKLGRTLRIQPERITVGNGADGVIYNLGMAVFDQNDEAVIPVTTFPLYETIVRVMRAKPVYTPMDGFRIDLRAILDALSSRTKAIFLCNPNNPTGDALARREIRDFLKSVPQDILVIIDEAYIDFVEPQMNPDTLELIKGGMENLFVIRSFSKVYGLAGIRAGYGIGHPELIELIHRIKPPFNVSIAAEEVALAALEDTGFAQKTTDNLRQEKDRYYRALDDLGIRYVRSHTNFVLIDTGSDATDLVSRLLREGIIVRPARGFGLPNCIRVTIGTPAENKQFIQTFQKFIGRKS